MRDMRITIDGKHYCKSVDLPVKLKDKISRMLFKLWVYIKQKCS